MSDSLQPYEPSTPELPVLQYLPELAQTHVHWSVMPSNHHILCQVLLLLPSIFPSIRVERKKDHLQMQWTTKQSQLSSHWSFELSLPTPLPSLLQNKGLITSLSRSHLSGLIPVPAAPSVWEISTFFSTQITFCDLAWSLLCEAFPDPALLSATGCLDQVYSYCPFAVSGIHLPLHTLINVSKVGGTFQSCFSLHLSRNKTETLSYC